MDWLYYEKEAMAKGYRHICGVDEAGRGPLAGPVCAAAVILPEGCIIEGVNDSKKLTEKKRDALFDVIIETAVSCSIAFGTVEEIERDNILQTTMNTMRRAIEGLSVKADYAMIDGNRLPKLDISAEYIVGGDAKSMSVAAASILAKVSRDRLMLEYAKKYPEYGFEKHKGYGTKLHVEKILELGETPIHRPSFLKKIYAKYR
ncbi:MAG: ribonuclease HII [Ruminococcus sp.]|uniref:ribonuclease HII n=1 Tax=Ruminococcus sp. TaxID=41978 RepID=UPI00287321A9|nr:ribonuclease HII [Ruminococcus sp.]MBQ3284987.1 ribonuclease HII [Ruminococcus sp.]